ncbi:MAG: hypothetical protein AAGA11_16595 [Pseudomonadota bacterium]
MDATAENRRKQPRRKPAAAGLKRVSQLLDQGLARFGSFRGATWVLALLTLASGVGVWWSMTQRLGKIEALTANSNSQIGLSDEINRLRALGIDTQIEAVQRELDREQERLFPDHQTMAAYLSEKSASAKSVGMELSYRILENRDVTALPGVKVAPVVLTLAVGTRYQETGFARMLSFLLDMRQQRWRHELVSAAVNGEVGGATTLVAEIELWFKDSGGFGVRSAALTEADNDQGAPDGPGAGGEPGTEPE